MIRSLLYLYSEPDVTLVVGEDEIKVHENVIAVYSGFFKAALNSGLKESRERRIKIREIEPDTLTVILDWLYRVPLTPLFDTDIEKEETIEDLLSNNTTKKISDILRAFDFLQIKGAEFPYMRFVQNKFRNLDSGQNFEPKASRNIVVVLNEVYRYGYCLPEASLVTLVREIYQRAYDSRNNHNHIAAVIGGLKTLQDPNAKFLQDFSVSLTTVLLQQRRK